MTLGAYLTLAFEMTEARLYSEKKNMTNTRVIKLTIRNNVSLQIFRAMFKSTFIDAAVKSDALKFGKFTLKSGRESPYFFNLGRFNSGLILSQLATAYAQTILDSKIDFDILFGPAYKGIPLAALGVAKLAELSPECANKEYAFNRKEAKDHGEGGNIVGGSLEGRKVLIIDDVITAGTAIREAYDLIVKNGGKVVGVVIALDRQEIFSESERVSTVEKVAKELGVQVISIVNLDDIIEHLKTQLSQEDLKAIKTYKENYGA